MPVYVVVLGPPGAGKGTQAQVISKRLNLPHISSGDLFRDNMINNTELGQIAKSYIDRGELVPDEITISMIQERLSQADCMAGALLDGFPRTPAQAKALAKMLEEFGGQVNAVPFIQVSQELLVKRLSGRWTCRAEGHIFHQEYDPPSVAGLCDHDGSELYQREDDTEEVITNRIRVYFEQTMPLIEYYQDAGLLVEVDGSQSIERVSSQILESISERI